LKKILYIAAAIFSGGLILAATSSSHVASTNVTQTATHTINETTSTPTVTIAPTEKPTATPTIASTFSCSKYYYNSQGEKVCSPSYSNSPPAGASAVCGDGTYSFSQSRRGTCSHHGGVSQWL